MVTPVISVHGIGKKFRRNSSGSPFKFKHLLTGGLIKKSSEYFWCLQDVSFEVARGQMIGIIGPNGSGKSTLLRLVGGVGLPDKGTLSVNGRLGALLDLGAGFHNDLSGRDNIFISGVIAGLTRKQVSAQFDQIVAFAELEGFLDNPLRTYSSGMRMRLAFAVAIHIDPEILLIDEVLSVGDLIFQSKCLEKINQFKNNGCTILLVSHEIGQIEKFCDAVLWLKRGRVIAFGSPRGIIKAYSEDMTYETRKRTPANQNIGTNAKNGHLKLNENRFGSQEVVISSVRLIDANGNPTQKISSGDSLRIEIDYHSNILADNPNFGVTISMPNGQTCSEMMLVKNRSKLVGSKRRGTIVLGIERLDLSGGWYYVDVGVYEKNWEYAYDYHWHAYALGIVANETYKGVLAPPHDWEWLNQGSSQSDGRTAVLPDRTNEKKTIP